MARNDQQGAVQGVDAVRGNRQTGAAEEVRQGDAARNERTNQNNGNAQGEDVDLSLTEEEQIQLSQDAQKVAEEQRNRELEEQQERQQMEIDSKLRELEQTKAEIQAAQQAGDRDRVANLTARLHQQEEELGALFDAPGNGITNAARDTQTPGSTFIPAPPGGPRMSMPQSFPMPQAPFGAPGAGAPITGGPTGAPQANPNAQIPDFGRNPSKAQIGQMLDGASEKYGIPPNILKGVAWQESNWNPKALSFDGQHGKGVMQIDDRYHAFARTPEVFDPAKNIDYGAKYLRELYDKTGSWAAALKRYNGGSDYPPKILAHAERQPWTRHA